MNQLYTALAIVLVTVLALHLFYVLLDKNRGSRSSESFKDQDMERPSFAERRLTLISTLVAAFLFILVPFIMTLTTKSLPADTSVDTIKCKPFEICKRLEALDKKLAKSDSTDIVKTLKDIEKKLEMLDKKLAEDPQSAKVYHSPKVVSWIWIIVIFVCVVCFIVSVVFAFIKFKPLFVATATISSILTISSLALFGIENFTGDLTFFKRTNNYFSDAKHSATESSLKRLTMKHIGDIGGFAPGEFSNFSLVGFDSVFRKASAVETLTSVIFVVGEVDHRELSGKLRGTLGSNITLARSRAETVRRKLELRFGDHLDGRFILTLSSGALHPGDPGRLHTDRKVSVYGMSLD